MTPGADISNAARTRAKAADRAATITLWAVALICLSTLVAILGYILIRGLGVALDPRFLLGKPRAIASGSGILPFLISSVYLAILTMVIILPIGVGAAIYMAEFSGGGRWVRLVRFGADSLATVPSIVFGLFGLALFIVVLGMRASLLVGAMTLALLNLPQVMRTAEEAILAVPLSYRQASLGLGATRWQTVRKVVLPNAVPGITTGGILTIGRILGESAALIFTMPLFVTRSPTSLLSGGAALAPNLWYTLTEALAEDAQRIAQGEAALLVLMIFALNLGARWLAGRYQKRQGMVTSRG
ncbi:MAG: phosphate ABC transporter permease PstA [Candidatus Geothermincolia bacterium]